MPPEPILDPTQIDVSRVLADREELRKANPQRFEMEQLDAIVLLDVENHVIVGYRDVRDDDGGASAVGVEPAPALAAQPTGLDVLA